MDKYTAAVDIESMTCVPSAKSTGSNVGGIPGSPSVTELPGKETSVDLDPTAVNMNCKLDEISNMGFVDAQKKPLKDTTSEVGSPSSGSSERGAAGHQADHSYSYIFSGAAGDGDLERNTESTTRKRNPVVEGVRNPGGVSPKDETEPEKGLTKENAQGTQKKRTLNTKPAYVRSVDLHPVVERKITVVVFDVETSGLSNTDEVIQLSATSGQGNFNAYILPLGPISMRSSSIHKITKDDGKLFHRETQLQAKDKEEAWRDFIHFCEKISPVLLVGHNIMFDARFTLNELARVNLSEKFMKVIAGFCDTLPLMRVLLPHLNSHSQEKVVSEVMGADYVFDSHNSEADVASLMDVIQKLKITEEKLIEFSFTASSFAKHLKNLEEEKIMQALHFPKKVSKASLKKLVLAGYTLKELEKLVECLNQEDFISLLHQVLPKERAIITIYESIRAFKQHN